MFRCFTSTLVGTIFLASMCVLTGPGCSRQEQVDVNEESLADGSAATRPSASKKATGRSVAERVFTTTPDGWSPVVADGMRKAAFRVERDSRKVEVTLIDLPGSAGSLLPNVNRWRKQIELAEITQEELAKSLEEMEISGVVGHYMEFIGPESEQPRQAILAVMVVRESRAWFAKLWGDAELALEERERFQQFVKSLRFAPADSGSSLGASPATGGSQVPTVNPALDEAIRYEVPEGWSPVKVRGLRRVTFQIKEGPLTAEMTATGLPGSATRLLPNVNLWRKRVGLEETTQEDLDAALESFEVDGRSGHYVTLVGPSGTEQQLAMMVVLASDQERTWMFKMLGDTDLVLREKERFEAFVKSVAFVPADEE